MYIWYIYIYTYTQGKLCILCIYIDIDIDIDRIYHSQPSISPRCSTWTSPGHWAPAGLPFANVAPAADAAPPWPPHRCSSPWLAPPAPRSRTPGRRRRRPPGCSRRSCEATRAPWRMCRVTKLPWDGGIFGGIAWDSNVYLALSENFGGNTNIKCFIVRYRG